MAAHPFTASDKPFGISQIRAYIPIILNLDKMNYDVWREIFETHCLTFGVSDHLDGTSAATPETEKVWKERDGLVKTWILYGTITDSLVETILTPKALRVTYGSLSRTCFVKIRRTVIFNWRMSCVRSPLETSRSRSIVVNSNLYRISLPTLNYQ